MTFDLPLKQPHWREETFTLFRAEIPSFSIHPRTEHFANEYLAYVQDNYMSGSFGIVKTDFHWNFYNRLDKGQMTNNISEGGNNRLASRMGAPHSGFYFCNVLTKELENSKSKLKAFECINYVEPIHILFTLVINMLDCFNEKWLSSHHF